MKTLSSNFFKSFKEINEQADFILNRLPNLELYFAHIHKKKPSEKLTDHIRLVGEYALALVDKHHLDPVADRLIEAFVSRDLCEHKVETGNFIKRLFWNTILFHDFGKINENFQTDRMNNPHFKGNPNNKIGSRHSVLSAFIFIAWHLNELASGKKFNANEKNFLGTVIFPFAGVILKHHASYYTHELNIPPDWAEAMRPYLDRLGIPVDIQTIKNGLTSFEAEQTFLRIADSLFQNVTPFSLFGLLRLSYSLLTAADYYATTEYSMDLKITDFGILDPQQAEEFYQTFKTSKSYNREFFKNQKLYLSLSFDALQERNPANLNKLRQKLMAEVLDTVQKNKNEYVFYLEAPTGAGKTNLSLAIALKLLKSHPNINKIFYVFPFTTLITQTAKSIKETLNLGHAQMVQLHSRSGFHSKHEETQDGQYGQDYRNYIDNLFVNYPITLMTHIKFFDVLKSTQKENVYLLHRLANSIVIIDELQSYSPEEWDKIKFFISNYAYYFNIRFILMSATLPKLDALHIPGDREIPIPQKFVPLLSHPEYYFQNPNFKGRVIFDFSLFEQSITIEELADFVYEKCEDYARLNNGSVKGIIEFIFKKRASEFFNLIGERMRAVGYQVFLLSGTILEPRRKEIIEHIKQTNQENSSVKLLLITTQVVEAGVDIDMDIGFKNRSLIDSDEQLAGRVNRNARTVPAKVYLFNLDRPYPIYGKDLRYRLTRDIITPEEYQNILQNKQFTKLYNYVCDHINHENANEFIRGIHSYLDHFKKLRYSRVDWEFQLISEENVTVYVPLQIPIHHFTEKNIEFISKFTGQSINEFLDGELVWKTYVNIVENKDINFIKKRIDLKKIYGIMSQYMFSIFSHSGVLAELKNFADLEIYNHYQILYLSHWDKIYSYTDGIKDEKFEEAMFV